MENASALRNDESDVSQSRRRQNEASKAGAAGEKAKWVLEIKRAAPVL
jgi:hypothetical protein